MAFGEDNVHAPYLKGLLYSKLIAALFFNVGGLII
jgi:hypothetical protein